MRSTVAVALLMCASTVACSNDDEPTVQMPLGAVIGLSGTNADASNADAIQLAERHMNAALSDRDYKTIRFAVDIQDSTVTTTVAVERSVAAVAAGALGIITDNTLDAAAVANTYYDTDSANDLGVPMTCGVCAGPQVMAVSDPDKWVYRACMSSDPQATVMLDLALAKTPEGNIPGDINGDGVVKLATVGTIGFGAGTSTAVAEAARAQLDPDPIIEDMVRETTIPLDSPDWNTDMAQLLDSNNDSADGSVPGVPPDAIIATMQILYNVPIAKAYKASGTTVPIVYSSAMRNEQVLTSLAGAGEGSEGVSNTLHADTDAGRDFARLYEDALGTEASSSNASYYDGTTALMLATLIAARDYDDPTTVPGTAIRDAMQLLNDPDGELFGPGSDGFKRAIDAITEGRTINYDGAAGPMDYDAEGSVRQNLVRFVIEGNAFVEGQVYDCISDIETCPPI